VQAWREVQNPWYAGWGIRVGRGVVLWNVSGLGAVELALADGRRFRIATDEEDVLAAAIGRTKGASPPLPARTAWCATSRRVPWLTCLAVIGVGAAVVLVGAAILASLMPAARASRVDVLQALRSE